MPLRYSLFHASTRSKCSTILAAAFPSQNGGIAPFSIVRPSIEQDPAIGLSGLFSSFDLSGWSGLSRAFGGTRLMCEPPEIGSDIESCMPIT